jgi:NTP pyrophosphatase (non-canonical NTP hydrolase)
MKMNDYQDVAGRTMGSGQTERDALSNFALGVTGEAGEVADLIKKHLYQGHPLDREKVKGELGDVLWYVAGLARACGLTLAEVADHNIDKLRARYPDGFEERRSIERASVPEPPPQNRGYDVMAALQAHLRAKVSIATRDNQPGTASVHMQVQRLVEARAAFGLEKYGQPLMSEDGRDGVEDALQEAGDLLAYTYKALRNGRNLSAVEEVLHVVLGMIEEGA